jgi:hypothetical protein
MQELLDWLEYIEDDRQQRKIRHTLKDILVIVLFATLANADDWVEMALFAENYQDYLRKYIELKNGIPSHETCYGDDITRNLTTTLWKMAGPIKSG